MAHGPTCTEHMGLHALDTRAQMHSVHWSTHTQHTDSLSIMRPHTLAHSPTCMRHTDPHTAQANTHVHTLSHVSAHELLCLQRDTCVHSTVCNRYAHAHMHCTHRHRDIRPHLTHRLPTCAPTRTPSHTWTWQGRPRLRTEGSQGVAGAQSCSGRSSRQGRPAQGVTQSALGRQEGTGQPLQYNDVRFLRQFDTSRIKITFFSGNSSSPVGEWLITLG